jgi:hypothetical protein
MEDFCSGRKPVPEKVTYELELFADWSSEVGDTVTKRSRRRNIWGFIKPGAVRHQGQIALLGESVVCLC